MRAFFVATAVGTSIFTVGVPAQAAPAQAGAGTVTIRVAQFNCDISDEYPIIPASLVAGAIKKSGADVVGIEEGGGEIPQVARALGWHYYDVRMQIVSRLPLIDPPSGKGIYTFVRVAPGRVAAIENVHLPSSPYGPDWVRRGKTRAQVIAMERRVRLPAIENRLRAATALRAQGIPVFLTGDLNSPSFRDWTPATVGVLPDHRYAIRWPVSVAIEQAGFTDSFRAVHPDPVKVPGLTWPTHRTIKGVENFDHAPKDRIDFVYAAGARATASRIIGEPGAPGTSATFSPWPSDHRLVVSTFRLRGAVPPTLVSTATRRVTRGRRVPVAFHSGRLHAAAVVIERFGSGHPVVVARRAVSAGAAAGIGRVDFASARWRPGAYGALLVGRSGGTLSRYPFWVVAPGARPVVRTLRSTYAVGQPITVRIRNAPGDRWDWLGIYHRHADPLVASYLDWIYTRSAIAGRFALGANAAGPWPLPPGRYSIYLLRDDLYVKIAGADFTIR
ncbi:MAG TPA: endonuclease/exonuclease/phosphatase family protein [Gaiellales bacterium]|nr:endonuclease/exonuclease/phosphatase family protein [Gaiellales bacterium]